MDNITQFFSSLSPQTIIIVVLVIIVVILIYRNMQQAPVAQELSEQSLAPSADNLLDKLEQTGAVIKESAPDQAQAQAQ